MDVVTGEIRQRRAVGVLGRRIPVDGDTGARRGRRAVAGGSGGGGHCRSGSLRCRCVADGAAAAAAAARECESQRCSGTKIDPAVKPASPFGVPHESPELCDPLPAKPGETQIGRLLEAFSRSAAVSSRGCPRALSACAPGARDHPGNPAVVGSAPLDRKFCDTRLSAGCALVRLPAPARAAAFHQRTECESVRG